MTTLHLRKSGGRSPLRYGLFSAALALACFALSPAALAVDPAPDGGYANGNTAEGEDALFSLTTGSSNTAIGFNALYSNLVGDSNTAVGYLALANTLNGPNTAIGFYALNLDTSGYLNTAVGFSALSHNTTGVSNTAVGHSAMNNNSTGGDNTAIGLGALSQNQIGINNCAFGSEALQENIGGDYNVAIGGTALVLNKGSRNVAIGDSALLNDVRGSDNIALGYLAGSNIQGRGSNNNIDIGALGAQNDAGIIRIGTAGTQTATYIAGISGATVAGGVGVIIDTSGHLGTVVSSERFKDAIQPMDKASEAILALKAVTFHYKKDLDPEGIPQFGLVAEEVEKVNPDLVARDEEGKPYAVRYEAVNAMLLNEFLKEHRTVQELKSAAAKQEATITQLKSTVAQQQKGMEVFAATLKEQASQIQKVSAQLELNKPAPRTVLNNQ